MSEQILRLDGLKRGFAQGREQLHVLNGASLSLNRGEIIALVGPSGSGKSTLLHIAGLLEFPDGGEVWLKGEACSKLSDDKRTALRRRDVGFVYQYHHLLPEFSALENVILPQMIAGTSRDDAAKRAKELLAKLNLSGREEHRPGQLSGGEQQRVAICRALANRPTLLLADEPTGNLDPPTADIVFDQLISLARDQGLAALIATHNPELARRMDRVITVKDGQLLGA
jgi:lipoprotein-releasing system ATP-binding protein